MSLFCLKQCMYNWNNGILLMADMQFVCDLFLAGKISVQFITWGIFGPSGLPY